MNIVAKLFCIILTASTLQAQDIDRDKRIVKQIADNIIESTVYHFVNIDKGKEYSSTKEIPADANVRFKSTFDESQTEWCGSLGEVQRPGNVGSSPLIEPAAGLPSKTKTPRSKPGTSNTWRC